MPLWLAVTSAILQLYSSAIKILKWQQNYLPVVKTSCRTPHTVKTIQSCSAMSLRLRVVFLLCIFIASGEEKNNNYSWLQLRVSVRFVWCCYALFLVPPPIQMTNTLMDVGSAQRWRQLHLHRTTWQNISAFQITIEKNKKTTPAYTIVILKESSQAVTWWAASAFTVLLNFIDYHLTL